MPRPAQSNESSAIHIIDSEQLTHPLSGGALNHAVEPEPLASLKFYGHCIILQKQVGPDQYQEYPVHPEHVAMMLASNINLTTGLMEPGIIYVQTNGVAKTVIGYRKPQKTGIFLEGIETPLRVSLPGLIMVKRWKIGEGRPSHMIFAVKKYPDNLNTKLFHAPIPNIYSGGDVCWGNVATGHTVQPKPSALTDTTLKADWEILFGTAFNNHSVGGKSKQHRDDIRKLLIQLNLDKAKRYPTKDLVEFAQYPTLEKLIKSLSKK